MENKLDKIELLGGEYFKPIKDYKDYFVSNLGRVLSTKYNKYRIITQVLSNCGYFIVTLSKNGKIKCINVHRLVAQTFISNPNPKIFTEVNHLNEIKTDNRVENLEFCTHRYNVNYGNRNKKISKGKSKPVYQIDLSGEFVNSFNSIKEAEKVCNLTGISYCCNFKLKTVGGYVWRFAV